MGLYAFLAYSDAFGQIPHAVTATLQCCGVWSTVDKQVVQPKTNPWSFLHDVPVEQQDKAGTVFNPISVVDFPYWVRLHYVRAAKG